MKKYPKFVGNYVRIKDEEWCNLSIPVRYFNRIGFCTRRISDFFYVQFKNRKSELKLHLRELEVVNFPIK